MLKGTIEALDLVPLLQLIHESGGTGELRLTTAERRETLLFSKGQLLGEAQQQSPEQRRRFEEELSDLLFTERGSYVYKPRKLAVLPEEMVALDLRSILVDASRRKDEWEQIHRTLPSRKAILLPRNAAAEQVVNAKLEALGISVPIRFGAVTVEELVEHADPPFPVLKALAQLCDQGELRALSHAEIQHQIENRLGGPPRRTAFRLYEWMLEIPELADRSERYDHVLLRRRWLETGGFRCRPPGPRALHILSRLLRYKEDFELSALGHDGEIRVRVESEVLALTARGVVLPDLMARIREQKILTAAQLEEAQRVAKGFDCEPGELLVDRGFLTPELWLKLRLEQLLDICFSIFTWSAPLVTVRASALEDAVRVADEKSIKLVIPLDRLREELRVGLMKWKLFRQVVPAPEAIFVCSHSTPPGQPRRAHDYLDGRRRISDLLAMARATPQELLQFIYKALKHDRARPLSLDEHHIRMVQAAKSGRLGDLFAYYQSALAFGHASLDQDPELARPIELARAEKGRFTRRIAVLEGRLDRFNLAEIIQLIRRNGLEGTLRVSIPDAERILHFVEGGLWVILSPESSGETFAPNEFLTESTQDLLSTLQSAFREKREERIEAIRQTVQEDVLEALFWEGASFEFARNFIPSEFYGADEALKLRLGEDRLLFEAARRMAEWDELRRVLRSSRAVFGFTSPEAKLEAFRGFGEVAYFLDGRRPLREILEVSPIPRLELYRCICAMIEAGLLQFEEIVPVRASVRSETDRLRWDLSA